MKRVARPHSAAVKILGIIAVTFVSGLLTVWAQSPARGDAHVEVTAKSEAGAPSPSPNSAVAAQFAEANNRIRKLEDAGKAAVEVNAEKDLAAQRSMAKAAWWMVGATIISVIIAAATSVIVLLTLRSNNTVVGQAGTQLANSATQIIHSAQQLSNSEAQLKLAQDQAAENRAFLKAQLRSYISIEDFVVVNEDELEEGRKNFWRVRATVRNRGNTPAENVRISFQVDYMEGFSKNTPWPQADRTGVEHRGIIQAGGQMRPGVGREYSDDKIRKLWNQTAALHVTSQVTYVDVFGREYERRASYLITGKDLFKQTPTDGGNDERLMRQRTDAKFLQG